MAIKNFAIIVLPALLGLFFVDMTVGLKCWKCVGCTINGTATEGKLSESCPSTSQYCYIVRSNGMEYSDCSDTCQPGVSGDANWIRCCSSDGCNGAGAVTPVFYAVGVAVMFAVFFARK